MERNLLLALNSAESEDETKENKAIDNFNEVNKKEEEMKIASSK